jgi:hypothetical protein
MVTRWQIQTTESGAKELWGYTPGAFGEKVVDTVVAMYRFRRRRWEYRPGFGERWAKTFPADNVPRELLAQLEAMSG